MPEARQEVIRNDPRGLRDFLAEDRTVLANERTVLAYLRTALTFLVAGLTFIKFFGSPAIIVLGWLLLPVAPVVLVIGIRHYLHMRRLIAASEESQDRPGPQRQTSQA